MRMRVYDRPLRFHVEVCKALLYAARAPATTPLSLLFVHEQIGWVFQDSSKQWPAFRNCPTRACKLSEGPAWLGLGTQSDGRRPAHLRICSLTLTSL